MAMFVSRLRLDKAALGVHRVLTARKLEHAFFGGYQLTLLGSTRATREIEVAVRQPFLNGFLKVKQAFVDASDFRVFDGNRIDCINVIHQPTMVHISIVFEDILPKTLVRILDDPNQLPFYNSTRVFIKTVQGLALYAKDSHRQDLVYLHNNTSLDMSKISKKVTKVQRDEALRHCGRNEKAAAILNGLVLSE